MESSSHLQKENLNLQKALLISIGLHALILGVFLLWKISVILEVPEFIEVGFLPPSYAPVKAQQETPASYPEAAARERAEESKEVVRLPERRMLAEEPELTVRERGKITPVEPLGPTLPDVERPQKAPFAGREPALRPAYPSRAEKPVIGPEQIRIGAKAIPEVKPELPSQVTRLFEIEGEAAERQILTKVLPQYPPGLTQEGVVKIRFTILPNGLIGEAIPILKSDARLEKTTLEAFRQWRFNPLPAGAPQETVEGVITFRYVLK